MSKRKSSIESDNGSGKGSASSKKRAKRMPTVWVYPSLEKLAEGWKSSKTPYLSAFQRLLTDGYCVLDALSAQEVKKCLENLLTVEKLWPATQDQLTAEQKDEDEPMHEERADGEATENDKENDKDLGDSKRHFMVPRPPNGRGIRQWGLWANTQAQEFVRSHPKVVDIFASLWSVPADELLCSRDAATIAYPIKVAPRVKPGAKDPQPAGDWTHVDFSWLDRGVVTIQGLVALTDQSRELGCLSVLAGGHRVAEAPASEGGFFATAQRFKGETKKGSAYIQFTGSERKQYWPADKYPVKHVEMKAGQIVLWFSQTPHQGNSPRQGQTDPRSVIYVCQGPRNMMPMGTRSLFAADGKEAKRSTLSMGNNIQKLTTAQVKTWRKKATAALAKKRLYLAQGKMTTHNPHDPHRLGGKDADNKYGNRLLEKQLRVFKERVVAAGLSRAVDDEATADKAPDLGYLKSFLSDSQLARLLRLNGF